MKTALHYFLTSSSDLLDFECHHKIYFHMQKAIFEKIQNDSVFNSRREMKTKKARQLTPYFNAWFAGMSPAAQQASAE